MCNTGNYKVLRGGDRAQGSLLKGAAKCDKRDLVPGWYRFQGDAGDRIPDKCVPDSYCGTYGPGWIIGNHPTVDEGVVTRKVCFSNYFHGCCRWSNYISVKNCGGYFVYELKKPPYCNLRYCGNGGAGKLP